MAKGTGADAGLQQAIARYEQAGTLFGHPKGLYVLFLTEMWERMSFYGMRALLVIYMVNHLFINPEVGQDVLGFNAIKGFLEAIHGPLENQPLSSHIYALYTAFVYATPFFGGLIADRWLGNRRSIILGGILMSVGHFLMVFENLFFPALFFLIIGNGAFKPNISTQVGSLYGVGDPRRDGAFTIFYMGINLGAFLSPLICGSLGELVGWHWGFGAAGIGMILGLIIYIFGQKYIAIHPDNYIEAQKQSVQKDKAPLNPAERTAVKALIGLCALNIIFWAVYEQQGNTLQLWSTDQTDWVFFGWKAPSTWFQSFNPLLIMLFAPLLNIFWQWQAKKGSEPNPVIKMAIGCLLLGLAFGVMILAAQSVGTGRGSILWLLATSIVLTLGELYLSPVGLSLVTKVAPARIVSMMMGMWFLSSFFGNYLSGYLGSFYSAMDKMTFFSLMAGLAIVAAVAMAAFSRALKAGLSER